MGLYDTYTDSATGLQVQLKVQRDMKRYQTGMRTPLQDGLYLSYEGVVVVYDRKVVCVTSTVFDKYGEPVDVGVLFAHRGKEGDVEEIAQAAQNILREG